MTRRRATMTARGRGTASVPRQEWVTGPRGRRGKAQAWSGGARGWEGFRSLCSMSRGFETD